MPEKIETKRGNLRPKKVYCGLNAAVRSMRSAAAPCLPAIPPSTGRWNLFIKIAASPLTWTMWYKIRNCRGARCIMSSSNNSASRRGGC